MSDIEKCLSLLQGLKEDVTKLSQHTVGQLTKVEAGDWNTAKGISFLEVKNHLMLSYLINLTHIISLKLAGKSLQDEESVHRLVEIRTVLEKMRPIDQKLKYQIDKLIRAATTGTLGATDPLRLKPKLDNLVSKLQESEESESGSDEEEEKGERSQIYRPPKLAAVHYDGDLTAKDRRQQQLDRAKTRALSSSIMRDLRDEHSQEPEEIKDTSDLHRMREDRSGKERTEYEEKYFVRTAVSKKDKTSAKRMRTMGALDDLVNFGDISALTEDALDEGGPPKKKKKKTPKGKGKKKGRRKFKM